MATYAQLTDNWCEATKLRDSHAMLAKATDTDPDFMQNLNHLVQVAHHGLRARMLAMRMQQMAEQECTGDILHLIEQQP